MANLPVILIDSREQKPWSFTELETKTATLETGDYTIVGLEHLLCIERKSQADLYGSVFRERFNNELERMKEFKYRFLVIEATLSKIWKGTPFSRMNPASVLGQCVEMALKHNIHVIFADNRAQASNYVQRILLKVWKLENDLS